MKKQLLSVLCVLFLMAFSGCGNSGKLSGLAPCSGTLTMNGSPVVKATVVFSPKSGTEMRAAAAETDEQGKFVMTTMTPNDGVTPGEFAVSVVKHEAYGPEMKPTKDEDGNDFTPPRPTKNVLPAKYASSASSGLVFTIPPEGNKNLEITLAE
jgi:hypothetical protein